jgi:UDP-N-acetylglucosamine 1-carboxyvinyltransferase
MPLGTQVDGVFMVKKNTFESCSMHAQELVRMGADIRLDGRTASVMWSDLSASASLVLAA